MKVDYDSTRKLKATLENNQKEYEQLITRLG